MVGAPDVVEAAVGCVGYGSEGGVDYCIVRNSWGPGLCDNWYIRMSRTNVESPRKHSSRRQSKPKIIANERPFFHSILAGEA